MPEVLSELVAKISTDAAELKSGLSDAEKQIEASSKKMQDSLKKVSIAMAAIGGAITATLGMMGKAAIDEEINIKRLDTTIRTLGIDYDNVKDSIEEVIAATQRKTGIADNEQRDILGRLIFVTRDLDKAMSLLPTTLDLMAEGQMSGVAAATYLAKAYEDLENGAESVGVRFGTTTLQFKSMADIQDRLRGKAEALKNPFTAIKNSMDDVAEAIGANLIPLIKDATKWIEDISLKIQAWAKENPELAKTLTLVALGIGAILTVVGGLILIMPGLIATIIAFGVVLHVALGPIGLISLAIMALIAIGVALWTNWDNITHDLKLWFGNIRDWAVSAFDKVKEVIMGAVEWVLNLWNALLNVWNILMSFTGRGAGVGVSPSITVTPEVPEIEYPKPHWEGWEGMGGERGGGREGGGGGGGGGKETAFVSRFQRGGIVTQPTMALLGEAGAEAIIPLDEARLGNITINFTQPVFLDREDTMNKFVSMIRQGIQRQDRLRYGGAITG